MSGIGIPSYSFVGVGSPNPMGEATSPLRYVFREICVIRSSERIVKAIVNPDRNPIQTIFHPSSLPPVAPLGLYILDATLAIHLPHLRCYSSTIPLFSPTLDVKIADATHRTPLIREIRVIRVIRSSERIVSAIEIPFRHSSHLPPFPTNH